MKKLYIVYVHITPDGMHYYGISNNPKCRWDSNGIHYRDTSLYPYIEKFGWDNIQHKVLYENLSYDDALKIEDSLIVSGWEKGNCINKRRSGNIRKEEGYFQQYYEENKQQILEQQKQYYEQNKDKILEQQKQYREQNKDKILEQQKQYREQNKDKIKQYREQNKDKKREYNREYYQRKKLEKQLKEVGTTPLF